jgi:eukaryotic-like serine/threonine-protein kinase
MIEQIIFHYRILKRIGAGGMGEVYLAEDTRLKRQVALKVLPEKVSADVNVLRRFKQEARAASALNHPHIVTIYDVSLDGRTDEPNYIAMEFVEGSALDEKLRAGRMSIEEILDVAPQIADALDAAHTRGITHRDIKPSNIMLTERKQVKVLDFGLAKIVTPPNQAPHDDSTLVNTETGLIMGTPVYMSPEQALGRQLDARTDIFSLGVVMYEMAAGQRPFDASNYGELVNMIVNTEPEALARLNPSLPMEYERIVRRCLAKNRELRYQSARELLSDLVNLKRDLTSSAGDAVTSSRTRIAVLPQSSGTLIFDSLAVMPLLDLSDTPTTEYLCDGITENIINSLSQLSGLSVMARSTVFRFKNKEVEPQAVGRELNVHVVLTGRMRLLGERLILNMELVKVADGTLVWGEQFSRPQSDLLTLPDEIAREVSNKLRIKLTLSGEKPLVKRYTENVEAYRLYLKGRYYWSKRPENGFMQGIDYYRQAIEVDPLYALAYAGLADSYSILGSWESSALPPMETMPRAKAAAMKALEIDEHLAEAHTALAYVSLHYDWDWAAAGAGFKRALELNPSYINVHHWLAHYYTAMGQFEAAFTESRYIKDHDPLDLISNVHMAWHYWLSRQPDDALEQTRQLLKLEPQSFWPRFFNGVVYVQKEMYREAMEELLQATSKAGEMTFVQAALGHAYALQGSTANAYRVLDDLRELAQEKYVPAYDMATVYIGLGDADEAFVWLNKAYEERSGWLTYLNVEPRLDSLRSDPRFRDLMRRVGFSV